MDFSRSVSQFISLTIFALIMACALSGDPALADASRNIASSANFDHTMGGGNHSSFISETSNRSLSQRDIIFRSILSTEGKDLTWPSFPRTWHEQSVSEFVVSNTALGLSMMGASGTVGIEYKWALKSSLVVIASNRMDDATLDANGVTIEPVSDPLKLGIFKWDPVTRRALPNIHQGYPMIAFCAFEASLNYGVSTKGGVTFMGNGETLESGKVSNITHTLFSRFFQVDGTFSPLQMLNSICADKYRKEVEQYVKSDFDMTVIELTAYVNPGNECQPDPSHDGPQGDASCLEWHKKNFEKSTRAITIPRCMFADSGVHRCQVTARENGNCTMYWDKSQRKAISPDMRIARAQYTPATNAPYEFDCDSTQGLICAIVKRPLIVLNTPFWPGVARCVRK